jgi:Flp pilus assembly protein TadB
VAADLGTWPAEQATVLVEVLHASGLHPDARRARGEVHVTVPDQEGDRAHATLVAQMDTIARAARPAKPSGPSRGRRLRAVESPEPTRRSGRSGRSKGSSPARASSANGAARLKRLSSPVGIAVAGVVVAFVGIGLGFAPIFPLAVTAGALVWVLGKRAERQV